MQSSGLMRSGSGCGEMVAIHRHGLVGRVKADVRMWMARHARSLGIRLGVAGLLMGGLCLSGSDGEWFPWINCIGMVMFIGAFLITNKIDVDSL
jgi:hypothetical protein